MPKHKEPLDNQTPQTMLGLIAGSGMLPVLAARKANYLNLPLAVFTVSSHASHELKKLAQVYVAGGAGEVNRALRFLDENNCCEVLFMGKVEKGRLFRDLKLDWGAVKILSRMTDRSDSAIMDALIKLLEEHGHKVMSQADFLPELLAPAGQINRVKPNASQKRDLAFGFNLARQISQTGVGQTIVLKRGIVLAVEAIEGTDEAIRRGCALGGAGAVVVKVAQSGHDPRYDLPTAGDSTIATLLEGGAAVLGLQAGSVLMVGREDMILQANKGKLAIVGLTEPEA
jgi:UDP-2,3-diacylglucosamine hydrolase